MPHPQSNALLAALSAADYALLSPHMRVVELVHEAVLFKTGWPVERAYFPHSGIISLVVDLVDGEMIEVAMVGRDGAVGALSPFAAGLALNSAVVQHPGVATTISIAHLTAGCEQSYSLLAALVRNEQLAMIQAQQSAACNACHAVEARMARWMLRMRDLADSGTFPLTQEFLAQMIGSRRTSVSMVANTLQEAGLIRYRRGQMEIIDVGALKFVACECYATVVKELARLDDAVLCP